MIIISNVDEHKIKNFVVITILEPCCDVYFTSIAARYIVELALTVYLLSFGRLITTIYTSLQI
jgi:hypothetical protein